MKIKRTKALTTILSRVGLYFDPDKAQVIEDHIKRLEDENAHLRRAIGEWQEATKQKHPTLTGF